MNDDRKLAQQLGTVATELDLEGQASTEFALAS
jgi:hypothetical protein